MYFFHSDSIWQKFPQLRVVGVITREVIKIKADRVDTSEILNSVRPNVWRRDKRATFLLFELGETPTR